MTIEHQTMQFQEFIYLSKTKTLLHVNFQFFSTPDKDKGTADVYELGSFYSDCNGQLRFNKCWRKKRKVGEFSLLIDHFRKSVGFGPKGALGRLPPQLQGQSIGRFCIARLIDELMWKCKGYTVRDGELSPIDACNDEAKLNRNYFYQKMGFELALDETLSFGRFTFPDDPSKLAKKWNRRKLRRLKPSSLPIVLSNLTNLFDFKNQLIFEKNYNLNISSKLIFRTKIITCLSLIILLETSALFVMLGK